MAEIAQVSIDREELYRRLCAVLKNEELLDLVEAIEDVVNTRNGFGQVVIDLEYRRVKLISNVNMRKPGVS